MEPDDAPVVATAEQIPSRAVGGRWVVGVIFALAIVMATFAWWWNLNRGQRTLEFLGPEAAQLVRTGPTVELLAPHSDLKFDLSNARGLINARASLLSDASYDWERSVAVTEDDGLAVRFAAGEQSVVLKFDFKAQTVNASSTNRTVGLKEKTAAGWREYLVRNLKDKSPTP